MTKRYYVYIMTSRYGGPLYTGVTNDLVRRVFEHKQGAVAGFTKRYNIKRLVHFEIYDDPETAIRRETRIKKWNRAWKVALIERHNPNWRDLYMDICR